MIPWRVAFEMKLLFDISSVSFACIIAKFYEYFMVYSSQSLESGFDFIKDSFALAWVFVILSGDEVGLFNDI